MKKEWVIFTGYIKDTPEIELSIGQRYKIKREAGDGTIDVDSPDHVENYHTLFKGEYKVVREIKNDVEWLDAIQDNFKEGI